jgi:hypothetical protein
MQSKPAISLRRPPPPAAVEAFIAGRPDAQAPGRLSVVDDDTSSSENLDVQASERPVTQTLGDSNAQAAERPDVTTLEHSNVEEPGRSSTRRTRRSVTRAPGRSDVRAVGVVERADGRQRRRLTVYLPVELAKRLVVHCAASELEMSDVVTDAVERALE